MVKDLKPSEKKENLEGSIPTRMEQRPYVKAFRDFITDSKNVNAAGSKWTPIVILEEFWKLWIERRSEQETFVQFSAKYMQRVERIRFDQTKCSVDDPLLFNLIKRFADANKLHVPPRGLVLSAKEIINNMTAVMPSAQNLPTLNEAEHAPGVRVYGVHLSSNGFEKPPFEYLAVLLPHKTSACCPAVMFKARRHEMELGLYYFATRECHLRSSTAPFYTRLIIHDDFEEIVRAEKVSDTRYVRDLDNRPTYRICQEIKDTEVIGIALKYFSYY